MTSGRRAADKAKASISKLKRSEDSDGSQGDIAEASPSRKQIKRGRKKKGGSDDGPYNPAEETPPPKSRVKKILINNKKHDLQMKDESIGEEPNLKKSRHDRPLTEEELFSLAFKAVTKKHKDNKEQLASCREKLQRLMMENKKNDADAAQRRQKFIEMKRELHEAKGAVDAVKAVNEKLIRDLDAKRSRIVELLHERQQDKSGYTKVDDAYIEMSWTQLCFSISNLVGMTLQGNLVAPTYRFSSVEANELFNKCIDSPHLRNFHLQGHIWRRLLEWVFKGQFDIWAGKMGKLHTSYCIELQEALIHGSNPHEKTKDLSISKAKTAAELDKAWGSNEDGIKKLVNALYDDLDWAMLPSVSTQFQGEAFEVVSKALKLHIIFMKSRAFFKLTTPMSTTKEAIIKADPTTMEPIFRTPNTFGDGEIVDFVVSPTLEKIGNADGEDFNQRSTLYKARYVAREKTTAVDESMSDLTPESMQLLQEREDNNERIESGDELANAQQPAPEVREHCLVKRSVRDQCRAGGRQNHAPPGRPSRKEKGKESNGLLNDEKEAVHESIEVDRSFASAFPEIQNQTCADANRAGEPGKSRSHIGISGRRSQSEKPKGTGVVQDEEKYGREQVPASDELDLESSTESGTESDSSILPNAVAK